MLTYPFASTDGNIPGLPVSINFLIPPLTAEKHCVRFFVTIVSSMLTFFHSLSSSALQLMLYSSMQQGYHLPCLFSFLPLLHLAPGPIIVVFTSIGIVLGKSHTINRVVKTARFVSQRWREQVVYDNRKEKSYRVNGPLNAAAWE